MSNRAHSNPPHTDERMPCPRNVDVLVVGEALVDVVDTGAERTEHVGGSPANVALGLGRLGVPVGLLTQLADDLRGRRIIDHLQASGVHVLAESMSASATSTAVARSGPIRPWGSPPTESSSSAPPSRDMFSWSS